MGIFIDLKKNRLTPVDYEILLKTPDLYVIQVVSGDFLKFYFSNRTPYNSIITLLVYHNDQF